MRHVTKCDNSASDIFIMWNVTSKRVPRGALAIPITRAAYSQTHTCTHYQMASEHFLITKCLSWLLASTGALRIQQLSSKMLISQFTFVHFFCSGWLARQKSLTQGGCDGFVSNITPRLSESKLQADGWWMSAAIAHTHLRWVTWPEKIINAWTEQKWLRQTWPCVSNFMRNYKFIYGHTQNWE